MTGILNARGAVNPPFGRDARLWNFETYPVTIGTARARLSQGPRRVELATFQAALTNTDFITVGLQNVAIANGFRQLSPGDVFGFEEEDNATSFATGSGGMQFVLQHPVELVDVGLMWGISGTAGQVLLVTVGFRQPTTAAL